MFWVWLTMCNLKCHLALESKQCIHTNALLVLSNEQWVGLVIRSCARRTMGPGNWRTRMNAAYNSLHFTFCAVKFTNYVHDMAFLLRVLKRKIFWTLKGRSMVINVSGILYIPSIFRDRPGTLQWWMDVNAGFGDVCETCGFPIRLHPGWSSWDI